MRVVPVLLERAIRAGLLLIPLTGLLFFVGQEGAASLAFVAIAVLSATFYGVVGWLIGDRSRLKRELPGAQPAPAEAEIEPLGRTALRGVPLLLVTVVICVVLARLDALVAGFVITGGSGIIAALGALDVRRAERRAEGRVVRGPDGGLLRF